MTALAPIGHNNPPPDPFEAVRVHIADLYEEAKGWLDGAEIATQGQADDVARLLDMIREAEKAADEARKNENRVFDEGKAAVQAKYAPLIGNTKSVRGMTILAAEACKAALEPWRRAQEAAKQEAARKAREEAEALQRQAAEAAQKARADDLAATDETERMIQAAREAAFKAARETRAAETGTGLRSYWHATITDSNVAARHFWLTRRTECEAFFLSLAQSEVRAGKRQIPGCEITEERRAV